MFYSQSTIKDHIRVRQNVLCYGKLKILIHCVRHISPYMIREAWETNEAEWIRMAETRQVLLAGEACKAIFRLTDSSLPGLPSRGNLNFCIHGVPLQDRTHCRTGVQYEWFWCNSVDKVAHSDPISINLTKLSTLNINMCHRTSKPDPLLWVNALILSLVSFKRGLPFVKAQWTLHPLFVSLLYDCLVSNCGRNSSVTIHSLTCVTNKKKQSVALHDWQMHVSFLSYNNIISCKTHIHWSSAYIHHANVYKSRKNWITFIQSKCNVCKWDISIHIATGKK